MSGRPVDYLQEKLVSLQKNRARLESDRVMAQRQVDNLTGALDMIDAEIVELITAIKTLGGSVD